MHRHMLAIGVIHKHAALLLVHASDLAHNHHRVFLLPQNSADWRTHLRRRKHRRRHLIEEWLKYVMVCPVNENDLDWRFAKGRNIVIDVRVAVEESVAIAKDVCPSRQVKEEEEGRGDSQSRKSYGIDQCEHIMYRCDHFPIGSHSGLLEPRGTRTVR